VAVLLIGRARKVSSGDGVGAGLEHYGLCVGRGDHGLVFESVRLGPISAGEGRGEDTHAARPAWPYSCLHPI
jgi:hypothetical protein